MVEGAGMKWADWPPVGSRGSTGHGATTTLQEGGPAYIAADAATVSRAPLTPPRARIPSTRCQPDIHRPDLGTFWLTFITFNADSF